MVTSWENYCRLPFDLPARHAENLQEHARLEPLRETIAQIAADTRPKRIACLGAGVLNDIPYHMLVRTGADIVLVDWFPALVRAGLPYAAIERLADGELGCAYCTLPAERATHFCRRFTKRVAAGNVCAHYRPSGMARTGCAAYEPGSLPLVLGDDVTRGFATAFARAVFAGICGAESWRAALRAADRAARAAAASPRSIGIEDASMDFVTSSLLISQFECEPYRYFSAAATEALGTPDSREEKRLTPRALDLQDALVRHQIERHLEEIARILKPDGICFVAFELFQRKPDGRWFVVNAMRDAVRMIDQRFDLDLDRLPPQRSLIHMTVRDQPSLVLCLVLRPTRAN